MAGQNLLELSDAALDRYRHTQVGFVWQQPARNLIPYLTVRENVELPMTVAGVPRREKHSRSQELLEAVGLAERRHHQLAHLSGGEQQRTAIAVALANRPALLLADEPTGEIDSASAQMVFDAFRRLNAAYGLTTIIVTHDPQIIAQVDRVVAIRDGRTSTETIRRAVELEQAMKGEAEERVEEGGQQVSYEEFVIVDAVGRLQIPEAYREQYGIGERVRLEPADEGLLIRPAGELKSPTEAQGAEEVRRPEVRKRWWQWWAKKPDDR